MSPIETEEINQFQSRLLAITQGPEGTRAKLLLIRQLLEAVYKRLSSESRVSYSGLFGRMQSVNDALALPETIKAQVNQLRIVCNSVAHDESTEPEQATYLSAIHALASLLDHLNGGRADQELQAFLTDNRANPFPRRQRAPRQSFDCVVLDWSVWMEDHRPKALQITVCDDDGVENSILLYCDDVDGRRWDLLNKALWKYATLSCLNLTVAKGRQNSFVSNASTLIVLEPDFLIDVSALADCFTRDAYHPEYFIANRLIKEATSDKMLLGTVVNSILDEMVLHPDKEWDAMRESALALQPFTLVAQGQGKIDDVNAAVDQVHRPQIEAFARSVKDEQVLLEPSFVCPEYGLQGRLDIFYLNQGQPHIVELKSGKPPAYDTWKTHQMQVVGYNLLIRNCFGRGASGRSCILYSASPENSLRNVVNTDALEQLLLMCRNRIVGLMHSLALDPKAFFDWLRLRRKRRDEGFNQGRIDDIAATLNSLDDHEYEWFLEHIRLAVSEIWSVKVGGLGPDTVYGHNALWQQGSLQKKLRYRQLDELKVIEVDHNRIRFSQPDSRGITDFRLNDIVVLYRQNRPVTKQQILRGVISRLSDLELEVTVRGGLKLTADFLGEGSWALEHDVLETSLYNPLASVYSFLKAPKTLREAFLGLRQPQTEFAFAGDEDYLGGIVARMRGAKDYYVVQGPPGTGKTSGLLTSYVFDRYQNSDRKLLILSFTNRAVDEICGCLKARSIPFIRTGSSEEVSSELLTSIVAGGSFAGIEATLRANRVWVSTVQSCNAWLSDFVNIGSIDELIVDEASQILENSILGIIARAGKTILVGDQNQLPPITLQTNTGFNLTHPRLQGLFYSDYNQSMMERLNLVCRNKGWNGSRTMLSLHYRMHEQIAELVQSYYQDSLQAARQSQKEPLPVHPDKLLSSRLVWIECLPSAHVNYDPRQVKAIKNLIGILEREGVVKDPGSELGIVSPFRAMIHALRLELGAKSNALTIDTVERFQGSERGIIIITLPLQDSEMLKTVEALSADGSVDRKLNVALSRAKHRIFIFGNAELCSRSAHYSALLDRIRSSGLILSSQEIYEQE
jgi:hypothetical protein